MGFFSSIPIIGRLSLTDYSRLVVAFTILIFEPLFRFIFGWLPLSWILKWSKRGREIPPESVKDKMEYKFSCLKNTNEFVVFWGYPFEDHYVTTSDGYILNLHRIPGKRNESNAKNEVKPAVLLWHGFLMCSEVFVCTPDPKLSLAFTLAQAGYDVWLGNSRGNKYSCKHHKYKPTDSEFWDFCFDDIAQIDLPDSIHYILKVTGQPSLSYIGFSQGSAQGFASFSMNYDVSRKINLFIALAPVTKPIGLENQSFNTLVRTSPEIIYLLFGRHCLLSFILFWQNLFPPSLWASMIDTSIWFIFSWDSHYIPHKEIVYRHLYSYSSVKCVVHWFQIMSSQRFQMYDDSPNFLRSSEGHVLPCYPTESINIPVALFYGKLDTLPDMPYILGKLPDKPVLCMEIQEYEHVHFLWAKGLDGTVYPAILGLLDKYTETWSEAKSDLILNNNNESSIRTVPWISEDAIYESRKEGCFVKQSILPLIN